MLQKGGLLSGQLVSASFLSFAIRCQVELPELTSSSTWQKLANIGCYVNGYYTDPRCTAGMYLFFQG